MSSRASAALLKVSGEEGSSSHRSSRREGSAKMDAGVDRLPRLRASTTITSIASTSSIPTIPFGKLYYKTMKIS
jgi:hypothetical protein